MSVEGLAPRGLGCGCISALAVIVLTYPLLFAVTWSCAHRSAEAKTCGPWEGRLVFGGMLVLAAVTFWSVRRFVDRADNEKGPE